ncbi:LacI family DNA-binding transcriptional regulator [Treponema zioleckii]|uniref:LacI family DNA-binding transcriptional regulator n=1 Tax=Treponema zioleckii TaxID=331680 RepID=UPI00168A43F7|nr:LacI family DNA-binding transcriptional regulator [Treponema zioleckii]
MPRKVTIQDIANEMGLSRNTVSKAINSTGIIADSTREAILKKASEMGYKLFVMPQASSERTEEQAGMNKELVLFTGAALGGSHFSTKMLDEMQLEASRLGYGFTIYRVMPQERENLKLPANFDIKRVAGLFCVEMFDNAYSQMLCSLGLPLLFIDTAVAFNEKPLRADVLLMENRSGIYDFIKEMANRGKTKIGFVGESMHCMSFYERYDAYMGALRLFKLPFKEEWCLTGTSQGLNYPSHAEYTKYLEESFKKWEEKPEVIICANDFVAVDTMQTLKKLGTNIPNDILLCGFDDAPESRKEPEMLFRTVYVESTLIYRESTGD